ncbi:MAG: TIGR01906 family membrane protein [Lachnospiraceae bacterium]|nr:TIGR01906 family membrane protein [Lachnospiraceae bacterium]
MKKLHTLTGILAVLSVLVILLITAIEIAAYSDWSYYEKEYTKLGVPETVDMTMDDLMDVTHEMMAYLRGNRDDLVVMTTVAGEERDFFNDQEKFHMSEVRTLFLGGLALRKIALAVLLFCVLFLLFSHAPLSRILPVYYQRGSVLFVVIVGILAALFASDFTKYFTIFHEIFFRNDLWLFDPATSLMINMLPETFWVDIALRVALLFVGLMAACFAGCAVWRILAKRRAKTNTLT